MTKINRKDIDMDYFVSYESVSCKQEPMSCTKDNNRMICRSSDSVLSFDLTEFKEMVLLFITGEDLRDLIGIDNDGKEVRVRPIHVVRTESYDRWEKASNSCNVTLRRIR